MQDKAVPYIPYTSSPWTGGGWISHTDKTIGYILHLPNRIKGYLVSLCKQCVVDLHQCTDNSVHYVLLDTLTEDPV